MRRTLLALLAVLGSLVSTSSPASADPIAEKRAEAEELSRKLADHGKRISVLAEEFNQARIAAERVEQQKAAASAALADTDARAGTVRQRLRSQAVESYVRGGALPALAMLVENGSQDDLAVRHHYVRSVTSQIAETLDELRAVRLSLTVQRQALERSEEAAKSALAEVESAKRKAMSEQKAQEQLLARAQGELAQLVAAEEKRRAEAETRRAQAELAARRSREQAASREAARRAAEAAATTTTSQASRPSTTTTTPPKPPPSSAPPPSQGAAAAIEEARRQIGKPYEWGGSGPDSFDCSGLTAWAWKAGGKTLPHSSQSQYSATSRVAFEQIQPGDLLFYGDPIHHVAIYIGDGQMIEAPETGKNVRYASIYRRDYTGAGRVN